MQTATTLTPEQVELRKGRITSTRIVKLVQGKALDVFNDIMGYAPPFVDSARPKWGRRLERAIIDGAAEERGWMSVEYQPGTAVSGAYATSPDAYVHNAFGPALVVEAKNRGGERAKEYEADEPLEAEIVQTQWHMGVTRIPEATVCVLLGGNDLRLFDLHYDEELWLGLTEIADRFLVDHINTGKPPPMDASDAAADYLRAKFPTHRAPMREGNAASHVMALAYERACIAAKLAEEDKARAGNALRAAVGDAEGIAGEGWKVTWRASKGSRATDWEAVARELRAPAEVVAKFTTERPGSRRLLVQIKGE